MTFVSPVRFKSAVRFSGPGTPPEPSIDDVPANEPAIETIADDPQRVQEVFDAYITHVMAYAMGSTVRDPAASGTKNRVRPDERLMRAVEAKMGMEPFEPVEITVGYKRILLDPISTPQRNRASRLELLHQIQLVQWRKREKFTLDTNPELRKAIEQLDKNLTWNTDPRRLQSYS